MVPKKASRTPHDLPFHMTIMPFFLPLHAPVPRSAKRTAALPVLRPVGALAPVSATEGEPSLAVREYSHSRFLAQMVRVSFADSGTMRFAITRDGEFLTPLRARRRSNP